MITTIILFLFNIVFKGIFIDRTPNSLSLPEIELLKKINYYPYFNDYSFRYLPVMLSALISVITVYFIYKQTKNYWLGLIVGVFLTVAPWIFILSRFFNQYIFLLFIIVVIMSAATGKAMKAIILLLLIIVFPIPDLSKIMEESTNLFKFLDLRNLFYTGDALSTVLRIPQTGFFLYVDLGLFFIGLYYIYIRDQVIKIRAYINFFLLIGVLYFFQTSSSSIYIYPGLFILYSLSIIIGNGYYYLLKIVYHRQRLLIPAIIILVFGNIFYYQELIYNHFDKKNSFEWGYAEQTLIKYFQNNSPRTTLYITKQTAGKLDPYIYFFRNNKVTTKWLTLEQMDKICHQSKPVDCLVRESELPFLGLVKEDIKLIFRYADGLPMYFLVPNR